MKTANIDKDVEKWMKKIQKMKKGDVDLSHDEDLSIAIMNLVSLEEHFYFTAMKTNNKKYLDFLQTVRGLRKKFLKKIVTDPVGEEWCISKHLLASSMRLYEVGCKELSKKGVKDANQYFQAGFDLWSLFFAINLKMIEVEKFNEIELSKEDKKISKFSAIMKKIIDCCKEW